MDETVFLGQTINSRLKDSHGQCDSETLTVYCSTVCVINTSHTFLCGFSGQFCFSRLELLFQHALD